MEFNKEYFRLKQQEWRHNNRVRNDENIRRAGRVRYARHGYTDKLKARRILSYAVKVGKVSKQPCEKCGSLLSQAHHDDYSKPLNVRWFCDLHHKEHEEIIKNLSTPQ
jgi:ribosomal protein S27AE